MEHKLITRSTYYIMPLYGSHSFATKIINPFPQSIPTVNQLRNLSQLTNRVLSLPQKNENIVVTGHDSSPVFAVGSLQHLMLVDDRDPNTTDITSVKVLEPAQGIRFLVALTKPLHSQNSCTHKTLALAKPLHSQNSFSVAVLKKMFLNRVY